MEEGAVMMVGLNWQRIQTGIALLDAQSTLESRSTRVVADYDVANVSEKVVRIIVSYVDYVNRFVWKKSE
jgi:UDP-N-acetylglucosamine 2-epimerase (non-hydrolysing)